MEKKNDAIKKTRITTKEFIFKDEFEKVIASKNNRIDKLIKLLSNKSITLLEEDNIELICEFITNTEFNDFTIFLVKLNEEIKKTPEVIDSWKVSLFNRVLLLSPINIPNIPVEKLRFHEWLETTYYSQTEFEITRESLYSFCRLVYLGISSSPPESVQMFRLELLRFLYKYHPYASKGKKPKGALQKLFKNYDERNNFQNVYALRLILDQSQINNLAMLFSYLEELEVNNKELDFQRERNQVKVNELTIQLSNEQQLSINRLENIVLFENRLTELQKTIKDKNQEIERLNEELIFEKNRNESKEKSMQSQLDIRINELVSKVKKDIGIEVNAIQGVLDNMSDRDSAEFISHFVLGIEKKLSKLGG